MSAMVPGLVCCCRWQRWRNSRALPPCVRTFRCVGNWLFASESWSEHRSRLGTSAGAHQLGAIAAASALLILLLGPPGYGIARRAQVIGVAILIGLTAAVGALVQNHELILVLLLVLVGGFFAVARKVDRSLATIALVPIVGLLIGSGSPDGLRSAIELVGASLIGGGLYLLLLDRVWPSSEHPSVALEGRAKRLLPALILALPVGYFVASLLFDWHIAAYAFALLAVLVILNARGAHRTTQHELLGFLMIAVLVAIEIQISVRVDVMVFTALIVAIVGAWRAERGTVPLWSILGTLARTDRIRRVGARRAQLCGVGGSRMSRRGQARSGHLMTSKLVCRGALATRECPEGVRHDLDI